MQYLQLFHISISFTALARGPFPEISGVSVRESLIPDADHAAVGKLGLILPALYGILRSTQ